MSDHPPLIIAISGASGFVGSNLIRRFQENGWKIIALGRKEFSLSAHELAKLLQGVDVIVNLAGAPVINRWTKNYKKVMRQSRVTLTRKLVKACSLMENTPRVFLSASAVGNFGSGWTWLVKNADGSVEIVNTTAAGCPLTDGKTPVLTIDVWEHAYYVDKRNARPAYVADFWNLVNWDFVNNNM